MQNDQPDDHEREAASADDEASSARDKWTESYDVNPHYHQLLVTHAAKNVIDEMEARNNRSRNLIITGLSAVIALLVAGGGFLVNELLDVRIESRVTEALDKELSQARLGIEAARLSFVATKLDFDKDFEEADAIAAIEKLNVWYADYVDNEDVSAADKAANIKVIEEPAILLLDILAGMQRLDLCFRLIEVAPGIFQDDPDGSYYFATALADEVLSAPDGPGAWRDENSDLAIYYQALRGQLKKLSYRSFPEVSILVNAMLSNIEDGDDVERTKRLLAKSGQLNETDKFSFDAKIEDFLNGGFFYELGSAEGEMIRVRTTRMLDAVCPLDVITKHCDARVEPAAE